MQEKRYYCNFMVLIQVDFVVDLTLVRDLVGKWEEVLCNSNVEDCLGLFFFLYYIYLSKFTEHVEIVYVANYSSFIGNQ